MLSVEEAIAAILDRAEPLGGEEIALSALPGRVAAEDVKARLTQPPFAASAMDGYAVRFGDAQKGAVLKVIGEAPAGAPFRGVVGKGEAVRIFTGGVVPEGADHIVIQEEATRDGDMITVKAEQDAPKHVRAAGVDFQKGDVLVHAGTVFHEIHGSLLAAANVSAAQTHRRPRVALFSNGDELVEPGAALNAGEIVNSNHYALTAMTKGWGGAPEYLGCAPDDEQALDDFFERAKGADIIVPVGGASVGDYDYVKSVFRAKGGEIVFEKVAVRPGKPTWFGRLGDARVIGLPGNPASAIVTAALFLQPLVKRLAGLEADAMGSGDAILTTGLSANGGRESYLRAKATPGKAGAYEVTPAASQDSSLLSPFAKANCLIRREVDAPACAAGDAVEIVWLR